jgi:hypothetical protein
MKAAYCIYWSNLVYNALFNLHQEIFFGMIKYIGAVLQLIPFLVSIPSFAGGLPSSLSSLPASGCSFYKPNMIAQSFGTCANYSAAVGRHGCTIYHWPGITYPGVDVQMWLPDFFVEVTKYTGQSMFAQIPANPLEAGFAAHLKLANLYFQAAEPQTTALGGGAVTDGPTVDDMNQMSYWQVRMLQVPFGKETMEFRPGLSPKGSGLPIYYDGISEFVSQQWRDNLADLPFATLLEPVANPFCNSLAGGAAVGITNELRGKLSTVTGSFGNSPPGPNLPFGVATPISAELIFAQNLKPSSDVFAPFLDPTKLCIGSKGPLIPRTGFISSEDRYQSAVIAAVKFMSLIGDAYPWGAEYKLRTSDKFQLVYPTTAALCFNPAGFLDANFVEARNPVEESIPGNANTYIFAVWREKHSCEDKGAGGQSGGVFYYNSIHPADIEKNKVICSAVGAL